MQAIIIEGATVSDEEVRNFANVGIEVRTHDGKTYLRPVNGNWQSRTVTGLLNPETNAFVGFVLSPISDSDEKRTVRLTFWTTEPNGKGN
jgi:hypothetical protein